jgi:hypothetical protein
MFLDRKAVINTNTIRMGMIDEYACQRVEFTDPNYGYILPDNHGALRVLTLFSRYQERTVTA